MNMLKNLAKMYCKKNPIKVATTVGATVIAGPLLGTGLIVTTAASIGGYILGKKIEDKEKHK